MNTIPHQDTPTEAADDVLEFCATHAATLSDTSHALRVLKPAPKPECIYSQVHRLKAAYTSSLVNRAAVAA